MSNKNSKPTNLPQSIKIDNGSKITVHLKPPSSPRKKEPKGSPRLIPILYALLTIGVLYVILLMVFIFPKNNVSIQKVSSDIGISYKTVKYLAIGDENTVEIFVVNLSATETLSGTITLKFHNPSVPVTTTSNEGASISISDLPPGGRISKSITIKLSRKSNNILFYYFQFAPINTHVYLYKSDTRRIHYRTPYDKFLIAPIGHLKSSLTQMISFISGAGLISLAADYVWNKIKKFIGWE